jgi:acyl dehydratase
MALTGTTNYFEDFEVGTVMKHVRGKTMCEQDNVGITLQVLNTAEGHFNEHVMQQNSMGREGWNSRLQFGGVTISMIIGMSMQDTGENALKELSLDKIRLKNPVFHGDTLYAYSEVLEKEDAGREDAGIVRFKHYGVNQDDKIVFEGERRVLIKRRPA